MVSSVKHNPTRFNLSVEKIFFLEKLLMQIEGQLFDNNVFRVINYFMCA